MSRQGQKPPAHLIRASGRKSLSFCTCAGMSATAASVITRPWYMRASIDLAPPTFTHLATSAHLSVPSAKMGSRALRVELWSSMVSTQRSVKRTAPQRESQPWPSKISCKTRSVPAGSSSRFLSCSSCRRRLRAMSHMSHAAASKSYETCSVWPSSTVLSGMNCQGSAGTEVLLLLFRGSPPTPATSETPPPGARERHVRHVSRDRVGISQISAK